MRKHEGLFLGSRWAYCQKNLSSAITLGHQHLVNRIFDNPERYSSLEVLVGVYAYAIKIYADFSGYTDVAIGSAKLFGYELPRNFDAPYTSADLQEFWRRWHISLSTWLRDYLYVTLGGNRGATWKTYRNLLLTMVLGGLWHGASWNFVIWGALHGGALAVNRAWQRRHHENRPIEPIGGEMIAKAVAGGVEIQRKAIVWTPKRIVSVFFTFQFVCFAWIFFRAPTFAHAVAILSRMTKGSVSVPNLSGRIVAVLVLGFVTHFLPKPTFAKIRSVFVTSPAVAQGVALAVCAWLLHFAAAAKAEPFIYGQF